MKDPRNTFTIIAQFASCLLFLLLFGFIPKPEALDSREKKPFRIPSITGFIHPVQTEASTINNDVEQKQLNTLDAIVQ